ncbi:MAG: PspC domain-containing protein [Pseudomonadaceae bacterium]|nr:PspC domain-containing protein [Pseudomonadaceae bacterium]
MKDQDSYNSSRRSSQSNEFSAAMARLERAVSEIVTTTTGQLSDRATTLLDDTATRLEAELRFRQTSDSPDSSERAARRRSRNKGRHRLVDRAERVNPRSGHLYRDVDNARIGGVCAGVARYFGLQTWTTRLAAFTGLLFLPGIVFPAYWIAYFIMDTPESTDAMMTEHRTGSSRSRGRATDTDNSSKRRENFQPSRSLRYTNADLTQAELRLRRLESFVTSDQYELHRELTKIEREQEPQGQRS